MFTRNRDKPAEAAPLAVIPATPADDDPEPVKDDGNGHMTAEYARWEVREAIRRQQRAAAIAGITHTPAQTRALLGAQAKVGAASSVIDRLQEERREIIRRRRDAISKVEGFGRAGYAVPRDATEDLDELDRAQRSIAAKLEPATAALRTAQLELKRISDAADADVARRRAEYRSAAAS